MAALRVSSWVRPISEPLKSWLWPISWIMLQPEYACEESAKAGRARLYCRTARPIMPSLKSIALLYTCRLTSLQI